MAERIARFGTKQSMARKKRKPMSIDHLNRAVQQMIKGKTEREIAILGGAVIEGMLFDLMTDMLVDSPFQRRDELFEYPRPLGSFGNMLSLAFAFGVISEEEYSFSSIVKRIRNYAAHSVGLDEGDEFSFSNEPVRGMIFEFYPKFAVNSATKELRDQITRDFDRMMDTDPRLAYRMIFYSAAIRLVARQAISKPLEPPSEINEGVVDENEIREGEQAGASDGDKPSN